MWKTAQPNDFVIFRFIEHWELMLKFSIMFDMSNVRGFLLEFSRHEFSWCNEESHGFYFDPPGSQEVR